jgi:hypothetical protein
MACDCVGKKKAFKAKMSFFKGKKRRKKKSFLSFFLKVCFDHLSKNIYIYILFGVFYLANKHFIWHNILD